MVRLLLVIILLWLSAGWWGINAIVTLSVLLSQKLPYQMALVGAFMLGIVSDVSRDGSIGVTSLILITGILILKVLSMQFDVPSWIMVLGGGFGLELILRSVTGNSLGIGQAIVQAMMSVGFWAFLSYRPLSKGAVYLKG